MSEETPSKTIDQLINPYPKNTKEHPQKQLKELAAIVAEVGWRQPSLVNQKGDIIVGHGRYLTWLEYGDAYNLKPIWIMDDMGNTIHGGPETTPMTEEQERMYRLADNKVNESKWIMDFVKDELKLLSLPMVDLTGFDRNLILETKEDKPNLAAIGKPQTEAGDVYQLGPHKIICGDSTDPNTYKQLLGDERARLIFTDPPYSIDYHSTAGLPDKFTGKKKKQYGYESQRFGGSGAIFNDDKTPEEALEFYKDVSKNLHAYSTDDASLYWWYASRLTDTNMLALRETGWHFSQIIIWLKNSLIFSPGQLYHRIYEPCMVLWKQGKTHYQNRTFSSYTEMWTVDGLKTFQEHLDVIYQKRDNTAQYIHPTQKPVQLAERALKRSSVEGDIVLDAFGGSGSTLIACDQLGRNARLIELDPKYVDAIVGRWCQYKDDKAVGKNGEEIQWVA